MNIFIDGLSVLADQSWTVFGILITVIWGQIVFLALARRIFKYQFANIEYLSLSMAGWVLPVALLSVLLFAGVLLFGKIAVTAISVFAIIVLIYALLFETWDRESLLSGFLFFAAFAAFLVLQFAFLKKMILPSYFDSAEHYRIIKYFAGYYDSSIGSFRLINYYHVGFHFLGAAISRFFQLGIVDTMLVFGQVILALLPFSLFFIVKQETGSNAAALFTCLLAGFGWHMPSHAMDWGKYPALFSLVCIHFVLNIGYLIYRNSQFNIKQIHLCWLLSLGVLISTLVHSRSLIVFAFMGISLFLTALYKRLPLLFQRVSFVLVLGILAVQIFAVQGNAVLSLLLGVYIGKDMLATGLVIFLFVFSALAFPNLTFFLLAMFSITIAGLFIPLNGLPGYGALTLLDRPYAQMLLYLPLSIWGGLGLAGLSQMLQRFSSQQKIWNQLVILLAFGFVVVNASLNHDFYSSNCCQIVNRNDLAAIQWMDRALPPNANVLIASANLLVTSLESSETLAGVDAGIWIAPLISRRTISARGNLSFDQTEIHADLCRENIGYVYVGGMPQSFTDPQLNRLTDWYQVVFSLPQVKVYQVIGCG